MQISDKISLLRRQKGLTQEQLAEILEVSRQAVYKWETGASVPELDKIKKLAQFFRISFDILLDDSLEIDTEVYEVAEGLTTTRKESAPKEYYRPVFLSGYKLAYKYIDIVHGYVDGSHAANPNASAIFNAFESEAQTYFAGKAYELIRLISVAPLYLYIDRASATVGIVFDGVHQFVCPFENLVDATAMQDGTEFTLTISYKDLQGNVRYYVINFTYYFEYPLYNGEVRTSEALQKRRLDVKDAVRERLNTIKEKIFACKKEGGRYLHGEVKAPDFDVIACYHSHVAVYAARAQREKERKIAEQKEAERRRQRQEAARLAAIKEMEAKRVRNKALFKKILFISLGAIAAIALVLTLVFTIRDCSAKSALKKQAQPVIEMIDALDGVTITLEHADELDAIRVAYNALSFEAKEYVTNWADYAKMEAKFPNARLTADDLVGVWESERYILYIENLEGKKAVVVAIYDKQTQTKYEADYAGIIYTASVRYSSDDRTTVGAIYDADSQANWGFLFKLSYDASGALVLTNTDKTSMSYGDIFYKNN